MNLGDILRSVEEELEKVEALLLEWWHSDGGIISQVVPQMLTAGGKRLRPALVLICARICGYQGDKSIRLAAAVELIHTASLIHDDVIDNATTRRGTSTINHRWGNTVSVLVGDHIYSKVFRVLAEQGDVQIMQKIASATIQMTQGELAQVLSRNDSGLSEKRYLSIIQDKTAALISCACQVGAMLGEAPNGEVDILARYGQDLGMAFQITDDLFDLVGQEDTVGKTLGTDISEGKLTLPLIHALRTAKNKDREWMECTVRSRLVDADALERMKRLVKQYGGTEYSLKIARTYGKRCRMAIEPLRESEGRDALALLPDYVVERPY